MDDFVDNWARERTTAELVQAIGRLRAVRRHDIPLSVDIHSDFPFLGSFGLEIHEVTRPNWRTMSDYQKERKSDQIEKGIIAFHATSKSGRRTGDQWLKAHGLTGISPNDWSRIKEIAGGIQHEYSLFPSNTSTDLFEKDIHILIEALDRIATYAKEEGLSIEDIVKVGLVDPEYVERVALEVLKTSTGNQCGQKLIPESA
jgi:hypothetical protein